MFKNQPKSSARIGLRTKTLIIPAAIALSLVGCTSFETASEQGHSFSPVMSRLSYQTEKRRVITADERWAFTTADIRVITQRPHPVLGNPIICSEPGPDVALALSTANALSGKGGNGATNVGLGFTSASAEATAELAGRSTALLALRDGLFRACEAYGNGVLGQDAYALILARYGSLMATLFLAQDVSGVVGAEGKLGAQSAALNVLKAQNGSAGGAKSAGGASPNGSTPASTPTPAATGASLALPDEPSVPRLIQTSWNSGSSPTKILVDNAAAAPPAATAAGDQTTSTGTPSSGSGGGATAATGAGVTGALVIGRMQQEYLRLGFADLLLVSCINEGDPTRLAPTDATGRRTSNTFLAPICENVSATSVFDAMESADIKHMAKMPVIDPTVSACSSCSGGSPTKSAAAVGDVTVSTVQKSLTQFAMMSNNPAYKPDRTDGVFDASTSLAVSAYQKNILREPTQSGSPFDPSVLGQLGVAAAPKVAAAGGPVNAPASEAATPKAATGRPAAAPPKKAAAKKHLT